MLVFLAFTLVALLAPQTPAATTGALSGRIVEEGSGAPISGAQVSLRALGQPMLPGPPPTLDTTTDTAGRFVFSAVAAGRYMMNVTKNGYAVQQAPGVAMPPPIEVVVGGATTIDRALQRSAIIVGRVTDDAGEPLAQARVMAFRRPTSDPVLLARYANRPDMLQNFNRLMPIGQTAQTNDLGEFRLFGLPAGEYFVQASAPFQSPLNGSSTPRGRTYASTFYPSVVDSASAQSVSLVAGQTSDALVIALQMVPAFQIAGVVVDESGTPIPGAMVMLTPDRSSGMVFMGPSGPPSRTDASGKFSIANVAGGRYQLMAAIPNVISGSGVGAGAAGGGFTSFSISGGASVASGVTTSGGTVATESRGGVTTQFRMDDQNRLTIDVTADMTGLQVIARRPN